MKNIKLNFKELSTPKKVLSIIGTLSLLATLIYGIVLMATYNNFHVGQLLVISTVSVPATMWAFSNTLRDIACAPKFIEIKNSVEEDKRVDAYCDYMEEFGFSFLAPILCLGMTIASFFIYTSSVKGIADSHISMAKWLQAVCHTFNITYTCYALAMIFVKTWNNKKKLLFKLFLSCFVIGSIIASFTNITTLVTLTAILFIGACYNEASLLLRIRPKKKAKDEQDCVIDAEIVAEKNVQAN